MRLPPWEISINGSFGLKDIKKTFMKAKLGYAILILVGTMLACSAKKKDVPIDIGLLPGRYTDNINAHDSIFIYADKSYEHKFYRKDGTVNSQKSTWHYKPEVNRIFFEGFVFYNDGEPGETGYVKGSWPTSVFVNEEGEIKLQYSESVYYVKAAKK